MQNTPLTGKDFSVMEKIIRESYPELDVKDYLTELHRRVPRAFVVARGRDGAIFGFAVIIPVTSFYADRFIGGGFAGINFAPFPEEAIAPRELPHQHVILDGIFVAKKSRGLGTHELMKRIAGLIHERKTSGLPIAKIIALADIPTGHQFYRDYLGMETQMVFGDDVTIYAATADDFVAGWFGKDLYGKIAGEKASATR